MPAPYTGQCLCGGCKVFIDVEPVTTLGGMGICHCKDCTLSSGATYGIPVPTKGVRVEGSVKLYEMVNSLTGNTVSRWFCSGCGSHLFGRSSGRPDFTNVKAGNIEEFTKLPIVAELFTKDRWPSIPPIPGAVQFEDGVVDASKLNIKRDAGA
ncbi:Mss4-like protein [Amanita rubescens]|nr:Mss4-like protein [Amanita rubescens]